MYEQILSVLRNPFIETDEMRAERLAQIFEEESDARIAQVIEDTIRGDEQ